MPSNNGVLDPSCTVTGVANSVSSTAVAEKSRSWVVNSSLENGTDVNSDDQAAMPEIAHAITLDFACSNGGKSWPEENPGS